MRPVVGRPLHVSFMSCAGWGVRQGVAGWRHRPPTSLGFVSRRPSWRPTISEELRPSVAGCPPTKLLCPCAVDGAAEAPLAMVMAVGYLLAVLSSVFNGSFVAFAKLQAHQGTPKVAQ